MKKLKKQKNQLLENGIFRGKKDIGGNLKHNVDEWTIFRGLGRFELQNIARIVESPSLDALLWW